MTVIGPNRRFAAAHQLGRYLSKADMSRSAKSTASVANDRPEGDLDARNRPVELGSVPNKDLPARHGADFTTLREMVWHGAHTVHWSRASLSNSMQRRLTEHTEQVRLARELGFDGVIIGNHFSYGSTAWFPPIETLMRRAAVAEGMSLGTCMLVLPLFQPVQVAEQFALLDAASGGRAIIGVSPGWQQEEFAIVGVDYSRRIPRFTEAVDLIRRLYTEDQVTFEGKHFRTSKATLALKPMQKPRPRMWHGASVEAAVKRVASIAETELGDTWAETFQCCATLYWPRIGRRRSGRSAQR